MNPLIIWTFRRSGGTNLAQAVFDFSEHKTVEHEPFNIDRIFGQVTIDFERTGDIDSARLSIRKILEQKVNIKHCLEIIPVQLNSLLAEESLLAGYSHMFLYREKPSDRLLSLNYALKTNIWGSNHKSQTALDSIDYSNPVDVHYFLHHEEHCRQEMWRLFRYLIDLGGSPFAVSFEMLYQSDFSYSSLIVKKIFGTLGFEEGILSNGALKLMLHGGGQGTKADYLKFPKAELLQSRASDMASFRLNAKPKCNAVISYLHDSVLHADIWVPYVSIHSGLYHLNGVLLTKCDNVSLHHENTKVFFDGSLKSNKISALYPDISNSSNCRFISDAVNLRGDFSFYDESQDVELVRFSFVIDKAE